MLDQLLFFDTVRTAAAGLRAVEQVDMGDDIDRAKLLVLDFLPGSEREPWVVEVVRAEGFVHPLFGDRYPCIELFLPLWMLQPRMPGYLDLVAASAAPCLDHQRFCPGAAVTWDPDSGQFAVSGRVRLHHQPQATLITELADRLRSVVALAYLTSFRIWQLQLRRRLPEDASTPLIEETHRRLLDLLGAAPPDDPGPSAHSSPGADELP